MAERIIIDIAEDGTVSIEAQGFRGTGCKVATAPFEAILGRVTAMRPKPEMAGTRVAQQTQGR